MDLGCLGQSRSLPVTRPKRPSVDTENAEDEGAFAQTAGCDVEVEEDLALFKVPISEETLREEEPPAGDLVYLLNSRSLGEGEPELGGALMETLIYTLSEMRVPPRSLIFMNSGVYLATKGSRVLDALKNLDEQGTEILSCGASLDYYGLKADLSVGRVTDMYEISERVREGKTISL